MIPYYQIPFTFKWQTSDAEYSRLGDWMLKIPKGSPQHSIIINEELLEMKQLVQEAEE